MRLSLRTVLIALVALVAIGGLFSALSGAGPTASQSATPSSSASQGELTITESQCTRATPGVSIVVDFAGSGQNLEFCQQGFNSDGWRLLANIAEVEGTEQYQTGFVCRINGWPAPADQDCRDTPRYNEGSWAYFVSNSKKKWSYSGTGASMHKPACGSAEAWLWVPGSKSPTQSLPSIAPKTFKCAT
jgi:hypothetical protein